MKKLALFKLLLLGVAGLVHIVDPARAQDASKPSAACNPWSASYWGDAVIRSQAEADEYACFRRIVGSVRLIQSSDAPFVLPKLHGVVGSVRIAFPRGGTGAGGIVAVRAFAKMLPALREVSGDLALEYGGPGDDVRAALGELGLAPVVVRGDLRLAVSRDVLAGTAVRPAAISDVTVRR